MPRILFVAPCYALQANSGGGQRSLLLIEALKEVGSVDVVVVGGRILDDERAAAVEVADRVFDGVHQTQNQVPPWSWLTPLNPPLVEQAATAIRPRIRMYTADKLSRQSMAAVDLADYDLVVGRYLRPLAKMGLLETTSRPPILLDIDDRDDQAYASRLNNPDLNPIMRLAVSWQINQLMRIFPEAIAKCEHVWAASEEDRRNLSHPSISVLPNIAFFEPPEGYDPMAKATPDRILFVGTGNHDPNLNGALAFIEQALPAIRAAHPHAELRLVGNKWNAFHPGLQADGVKVVGFVEDLAQEYAEAAVVISPVMEGGGTKIKVLEAIRFGKPMVAHDHSVRGLDVPPGALTVCDSVPSMGQAVSDLLLSAERRSEMSEAAAAAANGVFGRAGFYARVRQDCERLLQA